MPTTFLDLPLEIRDIIYTNYFTSPTGYLVIDLPKRLPPPKSNPRSNPVPISPRPPPRPRPNPRACARPRLRPCLPLNPHPLTTTTTTSSPYHNLTALTLTCRQIASESSHHLYTHNIITFSSPSDIYPVFKSLGQQTSRLISRVALHIDLSRYNVVSYDLSHGFAMLASRSRKGRLRDVGLVVKLPAGQNPWRMIQLEKNMLRLEHGVCKAGEMGWGSGCGRWLRVIMEEGGNMEPWLSKRLVGETMEMLHEAWRGRLILGENDDLGDGQVD